MRFCIYEYNSPKYIKMYEYTEILNTGRSGVYYWNNIFSLRSSSRIFDKLIDSEHGLKFKQEKIYLYGKWQYPKRQTISYGDRGLSYRYSGIVRECIPWRKNK